MLDVAWSAGKSDEDSTGEEESGDVAADTSLNQKLNKSNERIRRTEGWRGMGEGRAVEGKGLVSDRKLTGKGIGTNERMES